MSKKCIAKFQVFAVFAEVRHTPYLMQAAKHSILEHTQYKKRFMSFALNGICQKNKHKVWSEKQI